MHRQNFGKFTNGANLQQNIQEKNSDHLKFKAELCVQWAGGIILGI